MESQPYWKGLPVGCAAEVSSLAAVRASKQGQTLRQHLHERFEQWLDRLEAALPELASTFGQVSETLWALRQQWTGGLAETIVPSTQQEEQSRQQMTCPTCQRPLAARGPVHRRVETMVGAVALERPSCYCRLCRHGTYPLDEVLGLRTGGIQFDVPQAAAELVTEGPDETAATMLANLRGLTVRSERLPTLTKQAAEGLSVLDVAPWRAVSDQCGAQVAAGRVRRPVLVLGIDGAYGPTRPENARGRRPGPGRQRARWARWRGEWHEGKGFRFSLLDSDRIVPVLTELLQTRLTGV
jgi:hypothetical protein